MPLNEDDWDEEFGDLDVFNSKFMRKFQIKLDEIFEGIKSGKIKGTWEIKQIDEPEADGYEIRGHFGSDKLLDPIEPLKPSKRRPLPVVPFEVPETALEENPDPLIDVFELEGAVKIYVELPGEEKGDISLNVTPGRVEIKARNFHKVIDLPTKKISADGVLSEYKNGVLAITIKKKKESIADNAWEEKMV